MSKKLLIAPVPPLTDFTKAEVKLLKHWYKSGIVDKYLHKNDKAKKRFSFFDGPITANNPMGVHHGWGRTYKDLWQRYYNLRGFAQRFQNGFDCQGLWVEVEVEKELGFKSKKAIEEYGVARFVQKCKDRVLKYAAIQTDQSKRLGYFMDWDNSYYTMSDENNYMIWHFLKVCHQHGWLYKGNESVPWCPRCETAISQHEMLTEDYKEVTHEAIYYSLPIEGRSSEFLMVWTTTPWTIPANIAVAVDKKLDYCLVQMGSKKYWLAQAAVARVLKGKTYKTLKTIKGKTLVGLKYEGPFDELPAVQAVAKDNPDNFHIVVATDQNILPITTSEGTGMVHTAVSAGTEDFRLGKKLGLPMIPVIADNADYLPGLGFLSGKNAKKKPRLILDYLEKKNKQEDGKWVIKIENYTHRYPGCWRCKEELVWKVTDEWYIAMDRPSRKASGNKHSHKTLRQRMIKVAKQINWIPKFGLDRELDWLNNMHDWLISKKNRYWGLCLPIWQCSQCGHFEVIGSLEELKQKAVKGWQQFKGKSPHKPQIDKIKILCPKCHIEISRIEPVGNPWLDAGIISFSTLIDPKTKKLSYTTDKSYWRKWYPADFITESFPGQFKNWFYSMIAMATVLEDSPPYQTVLGFATLLGEDGRPMHKSWGNAVEFNEAAEKIGVDVMRWLYCRQNPLSNLLFGYKVAAEVKRKFHLLLWNSYRFFANYASLENWQPTSAKLSLTTLDQWILSRLTHTQQQVEKYLKKFDAFHAAHLLEDFVQDLSTWYIRRSRHRVGPNAVDSTDKHTCYSVLYKIFTNLAILLSPFIPFMADRIYTNLTNQDSVHLASWPKLNKALIKPKLEADMLKVRQVVEKIHSQRKQLNIKLRQPLAQATVSAKAFGNKALVQLILEETNLKSLKFSRPKKDLSVKLNTKLNHLLRKEGQARELIREIQQARKQAQTKLDEWVEVKLPSWPKEFETDIKQTTLAKKLIKASKLQIIRAKS